MNIKALSLAIIALNLCITLNGFYTPPAQTIGETIENSSDFSLFRSLINSNDSYALNSLDYARGSFLMIAPTNKAFTNEYGRYSTLYQELKNNADSSKQSIEDLIFDLTSTDNKISNNQKSFSTGLSKNNSWVHNLTSVLGSATCSSAGNNQILFLSIETDSAKQINCSNGTIFKSDRPVLTDNSFNLLPPDLQITLLNSIKANDPKAPIILYTLKDISFKDPTQAKAA